MQKEHRCPFCFTGLSPTGSRIMGSVVEAYYTVVETYRCSVCDTTIIHKRRVIGEYTQTGGCRWL